jgi:hypothetical protein
MAYSNPMTLGDLRKALAKFDNKYSDNILLLIRKHPGTRHKSTEYIYSGSLVIFEPTDTKPQPITKYKEIKKK